MGRLPHHSCGSIYVASTPLDMGGERQWLASVVFPELASRLAAGNCTPELVDLHRGAELRSGSEQAEAERSALSLAFGEITRGRPILIVLIGDCYGPVLPADCVRQTLLAAGLEYDDREHEKSLLALEVELGILNDPDACQRAYFYFRAPLPYEKMPPEAVRRFRDPQNAERLARLKQRIEQQLPDRVRYYRADWDAESGQTTGLEQLGDLVLKDLCEAMGSRPENHHSADRTEEQMVVEPLFLAADAGERRPVRTEPVGWLLQFAQAPDAPGQPWGTCVVGPPGSGKSTLAAQVYQALQGIDLVVLPFAAGARACASQLDMMLRFWVDKLSALSAGAGAPTIQSAAELERTFHRLLEQAAEQTRVVVLIDGVDQFEPTPRARQLAWLPEQWPGGARLIVTTVSGPTSDALESRPGMQLLALPLLEAGQARSIAQSVWSSRGRTPEHPVIDQLLSRRLPHGVAAAGLPLWITMAAEEICAAEAEQAVPSGPSCAESPEQQAAQFRLALAGQLPPEPDALCQHVLARCEQRLGAAWTQAFVNLIATSRCGLRESDLQVLVPKMAKLLAPGEPKREWDGMSLPQFRRVLPGHLVRQGPLGTWDFTHRQMRQAVLARNLRDPQLAQRFHTMLAYHLKSLPSDDPLRQSELMVHLIGSDDRQRAAHYYGGELPEGECAGATSALAHYILSGAGEVPNPAVRWPASLLLEPKLDPEEITQICSRFLRRLVPLVEHHVPPETIRRLLEAVQRALSELLNQQPQNAQWRSQADETARALAQLPR